ncbi:ANTAR domain-containing protein [Streptomyces sp. 15-116A]|uniref:ANTAR domain-containing response regulator n=1 Tax=Streptomyces sp. 15-116A TaxID=2259035 RepID=UPI0021B3E50A|nr:ANTAR domain-containing protein [Streptomyces sp. 15-116A]MCT7353517.1 ANTAR domain-containing protein [Streptomyces sp. 15-116A]
MSSAAPPPLPGRQNTLVIGGRMDADRALLAPRGELVHGCAEALAEKLAHLPATTSRVDVDMSGVHFMDTAALQFLDVLRDFGRRRALPVTATRWNGQPRRVLELAGLNTDDPLNSPTSAETSRPTSAVAQERAEQLHVLREEIEQLRHAIASRPVIDQARGILMATHGCTSDEAWHVLREASQRSNTKLREVAAALTAGATPTGPRPPDHIRQALSRALTHRHSTHP